ncbi:hypothetical protein E2562_034346 [Oryza meyeriana var. granulata]|uniref:Uncharacterized protein n=1 Tax=Oryza meyeriana var. granulata TaxID=110450 RepID=A0A6G1BQB1_9ORYZ|nr:hypothetical protein E2562_034346 [Oryza meyeriana var. granulata]
MPKLDLGLQQNGTAGKEGGCGFIGEGGASRHERKVVRQRGVALAEVTRRELGVDMASTGDGVMRPAALLPERREEGREDGDGTVGTNFGP